MPDSRVLGELIYCVGWAGVAAAIMYGRRKLQKREALRRMTERFQEQPAGAAPAVTRGQLPEAEHPGFSESLARLANAAGQSIPVHQDEEKTVRAGKP